MSKEKNNKGITLIALVITIIVMMILVAVSVTVALNGGLFRTAQQASDETAVEKDKELALSDGQIEVNGKVYASYQDYLDGKEKIDLPEGWTGTTVEGWSENVIAITDGTNIVPLPKGFKVSTVETEDSIEEGLVIKDSNNNEFVWIPVEDAEPVSDEEPFVNPYNYDSNRSEPTTVLSDTQANLNTYYGTKEDGTTPYYILETDFAYGDHYEEMVASVNKYDGFYVGRYETTIDEEGNIGSKNNTTVLKDSSTYTYNSTTYEYKWWGLYYAQRNNVNVVGNGSIVQSNMIWGQQWDAMINQFDALSLDYSETSLGSMVSEFGYIYRSGQTEYSYNGETINDKVYNIYDLRANAWDLTAEAISEDYRQGRGFYFMGFYSASYRFDVEALAKGYLTSRLALYIK